MRSTPLKLALCGAILVSVAGCSTTSLKGAWTDSHYAGPAFKNVLVVGITEQSASRRIFEDTFVTQLNQRGVHATASYTLMPDEAKMEKTQLIEGVKTAGADAVITTRLVRIEEKTSIDPPAPMLIPRGAYYTGGFPLDLPPYDFYGYHAFARSYYYTKPPVTTYKEATLETALFNGSTAKPVWIGTTTAFDPQDAQSVSKDLAKTLINALVAQKLL